MGLERKAFQGVFNIVRFNWHFYAIALVAWIGLLLFGFRVEGLWKILFYGIFMITCLAVFVSLFVSHYIYDRSELYGLPWLKSLPGKRVLNVNAGFDETSEVIKTRFKPKEIVICDFYNPDHHTEVSIKRARKAYPNLPGTLSITTRKIPFPDNFFDATTGIFSIHEIRNHHERCTFLREINRVTQDGGQIFITEHLRDLSNFLAYSIGFYHFYSHGSWLSAFVCADLKLVDELKITPFVSTFILESDGVTS